MEGLEECQSLADESRDREPRIQCPMVRFADHFQDHVLRREIVATGAVNYLVNRGGIALLPRLEQGARHGIGEAVAAWIELDRESEAQALRDKLLASARRPPMNRRRSSRSRTRSRPRPASGRKARRRRGPRRRSARSEIGSACDAGAGDSA